jgi:Amt family ammonium transporter
LGVAWIDRLKLDDPVGAISVHLICGIWGTLAVGIFGDLAGWEQLGNQAIGVVSIGAFCAISAFIILKTLKSTIGIRVSEEEEQEGLDIHEHGMDAYPDFGLIQH